MHTHRMSWHANELPGKGRPQQGNHPQRKSSLSQRQFRNNLWLRGRVSRLRDGPAWPGFDWKCASCRAHFAPQRRNFYSCWLWPNKLLLVLLSGISPPPPVRRGTTRCHSKKSKSTCGKQRKCPILQHTVMVRKLPHYILWISSLEAQPIWSSTVPLSPAIRNSLDSPPDCGWFVDPFFGSPFRMDLFSGPGYA